MKKLLNILRAWKLPVAMVAGAMVYYIIRALPLTDGEEDALYYVITHYVQPGLIFAMLFLSFLRVSLHDLMPHRWHAVLLTVQGSLFIICSLAACGWDHLVQAQGLTATAQSITATAQGITATAQGLTATAQGLTATWHGIDVHELKLLMEAAMLCFICPTATASAVIVRKLGGSLSGIVTYILLVNLMVAIIAPVFLPLVEPHGGMGFMTEFTLIIGKVFPLLLCPLLLAMVVRYYAPHLTERLLLHADLPFYLWLIALPLAITVTVRTIYDSHVSLGVLLGMCLVSLVCCVLQFWMGRNIGSRWVEPTKAPSEVNRFADTSEANTPAPYITANTPAPYITAVERSAITAGQAFGQKNTVFVIWLGLMFLNPVTSVVGGCYSIWHNIINAWQLHEKAKRDAQSLNAA